MAGLMPGGSVSVAGASHELAGSRSSAAGAIDTILVISLSAVLVSIAENTVVPERKDGRDRV